MRTSGRAPSKHQGVDKEQKRNLRILGHAGKDAGKGSAECGEIKVFAGPKRTEAYSQKQSARSAQCSVAVGRREDIWSAV